MKLVQRARAVRAEIFENGHLYKNAMDDSRPLYLYKNAMDDSRPLYLCIPGFFVSLPECKAMLNINHLTPGEYIDVTDRWELVEVSVQNTQVAIEEKQ